MTTETPARSRFSAQELLPELGGITAALFKVTGNGSVPPATVGLVGLRACQITGNTYTLVRAARELQKLGESEDRIDALASWWDAPYYTDAERAALALVEAVLQPSPAGEERSPTKLYARAAGHYEPKAFITPPARPAAGDPDAVELGSPARHASRSCLAPDHLVRCAEPCATERERSRPERRIFRLPRLQWKRRA